MTEVANSVINLGSCSIPSTVIENNQQFDKHYIAVFSTLRKWKNDF